MLLQELDDRDLIRQYLSGKENSFEVLITRHKEKIYTYIYMMVKDHQLAEDIFQDTFIKVIRTLKRGKYNEEGKFLPWVMRIAHNLVIDYFRKASKMPPAELPTSEDDDFDIFSLLESDEPTIEDEIITEQIEGDVQKLIDMLPDEQKEVVKMRHYANMSFKEIADQTGVSINTALGRMRYALINMRKMMKDNNMVLTRS